MKNFAEIVAYKSAIAPIEAAAVGEIRLRELL